LKRSTLLAAALAALAVVMGIAVAPATGDPNTSSRSIKLSNLGVASAPSGSVEFRDVNYGTNITECPQARLDKYGPLPADRRVIDQVEQYSEGGDDRRTNEEYFCFPQNETSIDTNPVLPKNVVTGQNDYRLGWGSSGFGASTDNGEKFYGGITPFPTRPGGDDHLDGGGDPGIVFDRAGVVYYSQIHFERLNDDNGIFVNRSTNGGFTWSRPCVPIPTASQTDPPDTAACGGAGDPRQPGDGTVIYQTDNNDSPDFSAPFHDKVYMAAGPRPLTSLTPDPSDDANERIGAVCFTPVTRTPIPAGQPGCPTANIGVDRLYVTWTIFDVAGCNEANEFVSPCNARIWASYSDDQARSWSPPKEVSGSAQFCVGIGFLGPDRCDDNQFSVPTVHQHTGLLGVSFESFNTPHENQYLFARSRDGGNTFEGPFFVTPIFDVNFPRAGAAGGRPDCTARGQQSGRIVYSNSCFRSNAGGAVVVDKRGGEFADDFYLVMSDNRNGTRASSNADIFLFKSINGGSTWIGPTRVNSDPSVAAPNRDCVPFLVDPGPPPTIIGPNPDCPSTAVFGNDQWWPWVDINNKGHLNVAFKDRRLDTNSVNHEWPTSRTAPHGRPGNYLVWTWGAQCTVSVSDATTCVAPGATEIPQPTEPVNPGANPVPGQGPTFLGRYHNFGISDFPSNFDYTFRAGIFAGDYDVVVTDDADTKVYAHFTDARNGRSSREQAGRNPACEQSDVMVDLYSSTSADAGQKQPKPEDRMFDVTPCPGDSGEFRR
jgi:hypothetical protein